MKPTTAGTLLPTIFYTLTLLKSSSGLVVPAFSSGVSNTYVPNQVLAQAEQGTIYTTATTLTITTAKGAEPTLQAISYGCPNAISTPTSYTMTATITNGSPSATVILLPCLAKREEKKSGLSQGAIVGIAVGVSIPVLVCVFFIFWRMWRRAQADAIMEDKAFHQTRGTPTLHSRRNKSISTVSGEADNLTVPGNAKTRGGVVTQITAGN
ncbi:hypothetical protein TWF481_000293 [Arthrobotrys musiformis]|uniref:Mid2 domain-containing protein n=1 Tax=Arthrobotrys musiformis TaxID=47236 RepID=A0AAV9WMD5_9PEZI